MSYTDDWNIQFFHHNNDQGVYNPVKNINKLIKAHNQNAKHNNPETPQCYEATFIHQLFITFILERRATKKSKNPSEISIGLEEKLKDPKIDLNTKLSAITKYTSDKENSTRNLHIFIKQAEDLIKLFLNQYISQNIFSEHIRKRI